MRVLVIEDSAVIRQSVAQSLRESGFAVDVAPDGKRGLLLARTSEYDAIILDLGLPELDGLGLLRVVREKGQATPILILTARDGVDDRVRGLQAGADDYLVKPFALAELRARVHALIRRSKGRASAVIHVGPLTIDVATKSVRLEEGSCESGGGGGGGGDGGDGGGGGGGGGGAIDLPPREYALLEYLAHRVGVPVPRHELEEHLYDGVSQVQSNAVDSAVCSLRARLEAAGCPEMIRTRRKLGYVLQPEGGR